VTERPLERAISAVPHERRAGRKARHVVSGNG
jgi:hypothetical protein